MPRTPTLNGCSVPLLPLLLPSLLVLTPLLGLGLMRAKAISASALPRRSASSSLGCTGTSREARSALKLQCR